ncbi:MAG: MerC domain-containing protein [bacterium]
MVSIRQKQITPKPQINAMHIASMACAIHCIATPFLIVLAPLLGAIMHNIWMEVSLLLGSIFCGISIIYNGYCKHKKAHAGLLFLMGSILWGLHSVLNCQACQQGCGSFLYLGIGTICVLSSYYMNHYYLKCCPSEGCHL